MRRARGEPGSGGLTDAPLSRPSLPPPPPSHPAVRQVAVQALRALYSDATHLADLEGLSERYMDRFLCLVKDKDDAVALEAVGLLGNLLQLQVIEPEDIEGLEELLMEESPVLRQAAGGLVAETIPTAKNQTEQFRHVLQFCAKILDKADADEEHEDAILLHILDALGPSLEVLRDWALLGKAMVNESLLRTDADASLLLKVVRAIVESSCGPASGDRRYESMVQKKAARLQRQQFTSACVAPPRPAGAPVPAVPRPHGHAGVHHQGAQGERRVEGRGRAPPVPPRAASQRPLRV